MFVSFLFLAHYADGLGSEDVYDERSGKMGETELPMPLRVFQASRGRRKGATVLTLGADTFDEDETPSTVTSAPLVEKGACAQT